MLDVAAALLAVGGLRGVVAHADDARRLLEVVLGEARDAVRVEGGVEAWVEEEVVDLVLAEGGGGLARREGRLEDAEEEAGVGEERGSRGPRVPRDTC